MILVMATDPSISLNSSLQLKNLQLVTYDRVRRKLEPRVNEETWNAGIGMLNPTPTDVVSCRLVGLWSYF